MSQIKYKIALLNANGLAQHSLEVNAFMNLNNIDIFLVSETHFTNRSYFRSSGYTVYTTRHPDGTAHGGTAVIIKNNIKHHELPKSETACLQATSVVIEDWRGPITVSAVYCPPRHQISENEFTVLLSLEV
jgi:hypothetical protein